MFTMTELEAIKPLNSLSTPNLQKLDGPQISSLKDDFFEALSIAQKNISLSDWRWVPVPIEEWIMDSEYLNLRESIRPVVFDDICTFFSTKDGDPWNRNYDEAIFSESIGSGKSFKTSVIATYFEHLLLCLRNPQRFFGVDQTSKIAIVNTSLNERNARKIIFSEISQKILGCKWFREKPWGLPDARMPCPRLQSELKFKNNTFIIPGSSSWRTTVGYNIIFGVMDEAGAYREGKDTSIDYTEEMYNALQRRIGSRFEGKGGCIVAGSPLYEGDFIEQRLRDSRGDSRTMCRRRSIWESKYPNWTGEVFWSSFQQRENYQSKPPPEIGDAVAIPNIPFLWKAFNANPTKAWRDFGAKASSAIKPFFESSKCIFDCINKERSKDPWKGGKFAEWFKPIYKGPHFIHVDLGLTGDAAALCMSHPAGFNDEGALKVYVDLFMRWKGSQGNPVDLASIREYIYALRDMGFNIALITFDSFASEDMIQILSKKNFKVARQSVDKDTVAYNNLKELMREGRIDYYCIMRFLINEKGQGRGYSDLVRLGNDELTPSGIFVKECCQLEDIEGKRVDHPHGEKYSKDMADACAGSINNVINKQTSVGKIKVRS